MSPIVIIPFLTHESNLSLIISELYQIGVARIDSKPLKIGLSNILSSDLIASFQKGVLIEINSFF